MIFKSLNNTGNLITSNKQKALFDQLKMLINQKINATEKMADNSKFTNLGNSSELVFVLNQLSEEQNKNFRQHLIKQDFIFNQAQLISPLGIFLSISMLAIGLNLLNTSIVERRKAKASKTKLSNIVESSDDGIITLALK
jgi:hypothetical protein